MAVEDLDDAADPKSSDGSDLDGAVKPDTAKPSTATDEADDSALSVVRDAVKEKPAVAATASSAEGDGLGDDPDEQPKKPDNETYLDVPFHKHPRFQHVLREKNAYKVDAERYQNVQGFLERQGLSAEEAADALTTAALMKSNPTKAWELLRPKVQALLEAAGEVLPQDLQKQVVDGVLTKEGAIEISRARAAVKSTEASRTFEQQQRERQALNAGQQAIKDAAETWEAARRARDPNFEAKLVPLQKEIAFLHATEGKPKDAEGVKDQLRRAYKAVNDALPQVVPKVAPKPAIRPVTGGQVAGKVSAEAGDTLSIIRANRRTA